MRRIVSLGVILLFAGSLATSLPAPAQPPSVTSREAKARRVLGEVQRLDSRLERVVEAFDLARIQLRATEGRITENSRELAVARRNLRRAQQRLAMRVVALYTEERPSFIAVLLGATSFGDAMDRLDLAQRVADEDMQVLEEVGSFRAEVLLRREQLEQARRTQERLVSGLAALRSWIEEQLRERQRLLSTIRDEIARLQASERARQARLREQAAARLAEARLAEARAPSLQPQAVFGVSAQLPEGVAVAPPSRHGHVVPIALQYLGIPYLWGGASPEAGFDCSGFVMYVYAQVGVALPHNAALQYGYGISVARDELEPGDIVFFNNLGHNGIYIGGGEFIQSPRTGDVVKISRLSDPWYAETYVGGRRLP